MKHQWQIEKHNYDIIDSNNDQWLENVSNQVHKKNQFAKNINIRFAIISSICIPMIAIIGEKSNIPKGLTYCRIFPNTGSVI